MDYKGKITAMVQEIKSEAILKKLYKLVKLFWAAGRGGHDEQRRH